MKELGSEFNDLTQAVIGAAIEVHRHLGPGFVETMYEKAMCIELRLRGITCETQYPVKLHYKEELIGEGRVDLFVERRLIVELKAVERVLDLHEAQVISYLKATGLPLGLLINFNCHKLYEGVKRIIHSS